MNDTSNDELTPKVLTAMRTLYAAPQTDGYWDALGARISARVAAAGELNGRDSSFTVLARWATPGLAAAALLLAMAGALWSRLDQSDLRTTYEGFTQPMIADAMPGAAQLLDVPRDGSSQREATLTYVLSH